MKRKFTCKNRETGKAVSPFIGTREEFDHWLSVLNGRDELLGEDPEIIEEDDEQSARDLLARTDDDLLDGLIDWITLLRMLKPKLDEIDEGPIKDILVRVIDLPVKLDEVLGRQGAARRELKRGQSE